MNFSVRLFKLAIAALIAGAFLAVAAAQELTIVLPEEPGTLDACESSVSATGRVIRQNVTEPFTIINPSNGAVEPKLALSWEQVSPTEWRFTLREGVSFHDGTTFNAEAAAQAFNRALIPALNCHVRGHQFGSNTYIATAVDEYTLAVTTGAPDPILPARIAFVDVSAPSTSTELKTRAPIGTGPYVFKEWAAGQRIVIERAPNYWGATPVVERATYIWRTEPAVRAAMVPVGEAEIALDLAPQDANTELDITYPDSETVFAMIDTTVAPLDDIRLRRAMNLAIDRNALIGTVFSPGVTPATQIILPSVNGFNPDIPVWPYDPEEAMRLLAEAKADGVATNTEITFYGRVGVYPNATESLEAAQAMLNAVGFNIKLEMLEVNAWLETLIKPYSDNRPPSLIQVMHDNNKGDAVFSLATKFHSEGSESKINDSVVDDLLERATDAVGAERTELFQSAAAYLHDEIVPIVPFFYMVSTLRVAENVQFVPDVTTTSELPLAAVSFK